MSGRWDLYVLDPALIFVGLLGIFYMLYQERLSWKWIFFFVETIFYWFANGILAKWNANLIGIDELGRAGQILSNPLVITLILFATGAFVAIILKPLATWSTGMAHHRRWWMYGSIAATVIALVLTFLNSGWFEATALRYAMFFIVGILLGMSISANSLYFLFANEQFYYRIAPALVGALMSVTTLFGTFCGNYAVSIDDILKTDVVSFTGSNIHLALFIVGMVALGLSSLLVLVNVENPANVRGFDFEILNQLPKYSKKVVINIIISLVAISAFYALTQSDLVTDFIETELIIKGNNLDTARAWTRTFHTFNSIPQIILGYFIYRYVTRNVGFKSVMMGGIFVSIIACVILVFTANPYAFIFLNLVIGLVTSQVFFAYFSMAIMWNYRSHGFPVTGFASAANSVGPFIVNTIINELKHRSVGIYKDYGILSNLTDDNLNANMDKIKGFNNSADDVTTILFAGVVVCLVIAELWIYFTSKVAFADYLDIKTANANLRKLLRVNLSKKIETRVNDKTLEITNE